MAHNRADAREHHSRVRTDTRHHVMRATLVRRLAVGHGANDRQLVRHLGRVLQVLREPLTSVGLHRAQRTTVFGRRKILRIPRLLMRRAAGQINIDDVLGLAGLALASDVAPILAGGLRLETE